MATLGEGSTLSFGGTLLGSIISISFSSARGTIETTSLDTAGGGKTFLQATFYEGEVSVECYADPGGTGHTGIEAYLASTDPTNTTGALVFTLGGSAGSYTTTAIPTGLDTSVGLESAATTTYTFKLTSNITIDD